MIVTRPKSSGQPMPAAEPEDKRKPRKLEMRFGSGGAGQDHVKFSAPFLDNTLQKMLQLQNRMLRTTGELSKSEGVDEKVIKEHAAQSAELSRIIAMIWYGSLLLPMATSFFGKHANDNTFSAPKRQDRSSRKHVMASRRVTFTAHVYLKRVTALHISSSHGRAGVYTAMYRYAHNRTIKSSIEAPRHRVPFAEQNCKLSFLCLSRNNGL